MILAACEFLCRTPYMCSQNIPSCHSAISHSASVSVCEAKYTVSSVIFVAQIICAASPSWMEQADTFLRTSFALPKCMRTTYSSIVLCPPDLHTSEGFCFCREPRNLMFEAILRVDTSAL